MLVYPLAAQLPHCGGHAVGAGLGAAHLHALALELRAKVIPPGSGETVLLDLQGIHTATASYLKSTLLWLHLCGQLTKTSAAGTFPVVDSANPAPCELFPLAAHVSEEVAIELSIYEKETR